MDPELQHTGASREKAPLGTGNARRQPAGPAALRAWSQPPPVHDWWPVSVTSGSSSQRMQ